MNPVARAEARIKQLCCIGLPSEAIIPAVLKELHAVVPSCGNSFFWSDEHYQLSNLYDETPASAEIADLYMQEFYNRPERNLIPGFTYGMRHMYGVFESDRWLTVDRRTYRKSDYYNLINRPMGYAHALFFTVRAGGRGLGTLVVWHGWDDVEFSARDKRRLTNLESFIAHAVSCSMRDELEVPLVDDDDKGLVIVDQDDKIQYLSPRAGKLLFLATHPQVTPRSAHGEAARLPAEVIRLCQNLRAVFAGRQDAAVAPPVQRHRNPWGGFTFRAYWLDNSDPLASLIGITIEHQVPLPVKVVREMERFALSRRQMQICLLLAAGHSHAQIARQMDMRRDTAITHCRRLYDKLDVHNHAELMNKLLNS